jgi:signal transduction histidine kinase
LWFRPELIETVSWGGDPKESFARDSGGRLHPRHSFALWREEVRCRSRPWTASDLEAADELQRRALEVDLERRLSTEQRAVRARDELLAIVSHDLRSPLSTIAMQAELMLQKAPGGGGAAAREGAERISRSAAHMKALIEDLMDLAKIEAQHFVVRLQCVDSRSIVEEALLAVVPLAEAKRISVSAELIDAPELQADPGQILRVLSNLLGNAIKFTPERGTVTVHMERSDVELMITVADTGPGIPADHLPWVFERYWQALPANQVGAGLGLYIAKGIVAAHGGRIWAETSPSGARFTFTLPLAC